MAILSADRSSEGSVTYGGNSDNSGAETYNIYQTADFRFMIFVDVTVACPISCTRLSEILFHARPFVERGCGFVVMVTGAGDP